MRKVSVLKKMFQLSWVLLFCFLTSVSWSQSKAPLKVGVIGLSHSHVHQILGRQDKGDIKIVGIVEPDTDLATRYAKQYGYSMDMVFSSMKAMTNQIKPEAVTAFNSIYDHLAVVEHFAPLGIHVMVEKPLAVSLKHAKKMKALADKHRIHLLTNYETTWYPTNHKAYEMVQNNAIGELRKVVIHDGHQGPKEIGVNVEFLDWLTDPILNGGGALTDFGCYGANLITWLTAGERPLSVSAITQTNKPNIYPKVDDEATILLQYPKLQVILQASWNWPFSRKDMHIYGKTGYIFSDNASQLRYRLKESDPETTQTPKSLNPPYNDPFTFLEAVVRNKIKLQPYSLSSLENNMLAVEILEMAKKSAKKGKQIKIK